MKATHDRCAGWHRPVRQATAVLMSLVLSACGAIRPPTLPLTLAEAEDRTPLVAMPAARAWINPPGILLVTQRRLVRGSEQRIALANATTLGGENQAILRTRNTFGMPTRLNFEEMIRRADGPPPPFGDLESGEMVTSEDDLGVYFWAERRAGSDTICVLALRRIASAARQLPESADFMDILLRNCVRGGADEALIPILASSVATSPLLAPAPGQTRLISALAGPTPQ